MEKSILVKTRLYRLHVKCLQILMACACLTPVTMPTPANASALPSSFSVSTFNIEWYGLNGNPRSRLGQEKRNKTIKAHMDANRVWSDVMAFEEIVDLDGLRRDLVGSSYDCEGYRSYQDRHQHVVLCARKPLRLVKAADDDNFTLEDVSLNDRVRPAVHAVLTTASGTPLAHIIAVHLKAMPNSSRTRTQQIEYIAEYLSQRDDNLPVVLTGDFNTFNDDASAFTRIFDEYDLDLSEVEHAQPFTWRGPGFDPATFSRMWASNSLSPAGKAKVLGPCNEPASRQAVIDRYNREVSDHCPLQASFRP